MKIDFTQQLKDEDGCIAKQLDASGKETVLTLQWLSSFALLRQAPEGYDVVELYKLGMQIINSTEPLDLTVEQVALIQNRIKKLSLFPVITGQAILLLNQSEI